LAQIKKNEEINASKIYSPSGKFAERAKICAKYDDVDQYNGIGSLDTAYYTLRCMYCIYLLLLLENRNSRRMGNRSHN